MESCSITHGGDRAIKEVNSCRLCSSKCCGSCFPTVVSMLTIPFPGLSPFLHSITHISVRLLGFYYKCSWLLRTPPPIFLFYTIPLNASLQDRAVGHQGREIQGEWKGAMLSKVFWNNHRVLAPAKNLVGGWDSELALIFKVLHAYILGGFCLLFWFGLWFTSPLSWLLSLSGQAWSAGGVFCASSQTESCWHWMPTSWGGTA